VNPLEVSSMASPRWGDEGSFKNIERESETALSALRRVSSYSTPINYRSQE
jgi:hypothetical protein